jgi:hypothetical protein
MLAALILFMAGPDMTQNDVSVSVKEPAAAHMENAFHARCDGLRLSLSGFGASGGVKLSVNGKEVDIAATPLPAALSQAGALYRFSAVCDRDSMSVKYYAANGLGGETRYRVGRFTVDPKGRVQYHGEETAGGDAFWFK